MRHGNGEYSTGGENPTTFQGEWVNDVKHGHGRLVYPDGETIEGTWANDRMNGVARVKKPKASEWVEVIYQDDLVVLCTKKGMTETEIYHTVCAVGLMILFYGMIPLGMIESQSYYYVMIGIYIIYIIHACCQASTKYIFNLRSLM